MILLRHCFSLGGIILIDIQIVVVTVVIVVVVIIVVIVVVVVVLHYPPGQMVRVGLCISTGSCHGLGHAALAPRHVSHVSQCRQLYLDQRLVAVTQTGEVKVGQVKILMEDLSNFLFKVEMFSFPSCCSCHIMNLIH